MKYLQERALCGRGQGRTQFLHSLTGIAVGGADLLYVTGDSSVKVFDPEGDFLQAWSISQPGLSVGIDDRAVYVGEEGQIEIFDTSGRLVSTWSDSVLLGRVTAIDFLEDEIIAADSLARCLRRF
ncbi:MAG: hypothetical protein ACWGQW_16345, partial [bacterium]